MPTSIIVEIIASKACGTFWTMHILAHFEHIFNNIGTFWTMPMMFCLHIQIFSASLQWMLQTFTVMFLCLLLLIVAKLVFENSKSVYYLWTAICFCLWGNYWFRYLNCRGLGIWLTFKFDSLLSFYIKKIRQNERLSCDVDVRSFHKKPLVNKRVIFMGVSRHLNT